MFESRARLGGSNTLPPSVPEERVVSGLGVEGVAVVGGSACKYGTSLSSPIAWVD